MGITQRPAGTLALKCMFRGAQVDQCVGKNMPWSQDAGLALATQVTYPGLVHLRLQMEPH